MDSDWSFNTEKKFVNNPGSLPLTFEPKIDWVMGDNYHQETNLWMAYRQTDTQTHRQVISIG